jgi:hypothetical protein
MASLTDTTPAGQLRVNRYRSLRDPMDVPDGGGVRIVARREKVLRATRRPLQSNHRIERLAGQLRARSTLPPQLTFQSGISLN